MMLCQSRRCALIVHRHSHLAGQMLETRLGRKLARSVRRVHLPGGMCVLERRRTEHCGGRLAWKRLSAVAPALLALLFAVVLLADQFHAIDLCNH
jgi:hypothetical protein